MSKKIGFVKKTNAKTKYLPKTPLSDWTGISTDEILMYWFAAVQAPVKQGFTQNPT